VLTACDEEHAVTSCRMRRPRGPTGARCSAAIRKKSCPCARTPQGDAALQAIKEAINDYGELEMGHREYFWGRPHSAGCKHT